VKRGLAITMIIVGSLGMMAAGAQRRYDWVDRQFGAQEKHLDAVDRTAQENKHAEEEDVKSLRQAYDDLLVRVTGDEKLVEGGFGVIMFLLTSGGFVWYIRTVLSGKPRRSTP
jgi:hypothetical protein